MDTPLGGKGCRAVWRFDVEGVQRHRDQRVVAEDTDQIDEGLLAEDLLG